jgi:hypothetical protein
MLASTERELAICEADVKMNTCLALFMFVPLRFDRTTPGIARNPTLAVNMTVDWLQSRKRQPHAHAMLNTNP